MSDFVIVKGVDVRVGDNVRLVTTGVVDQIDHFDTPRPIRFKDGEWPKANKLVSVEILPSPLVVGDMIVHKECPNDPPKEHRKIEALLDFNGQPHLVCAPWGGYGQDAKIIVPVADYVRAKT